VQFCRHCPANKKSKSRLPAGSSVVIDGVSGSDVVIDGVPGASVAKNITYNTVDSYFKKTFVKNIITILNYVLNYKCHKDKDQQ